MLKDRLKQLFVIGISVFLKFTYLAQSITPQSLNTTGKKLNQINGSLSFTVGDLVVKGLSDSQGNTVGSGFTISSTLTTLSIQETDNDVLDIVVFPNPTSELVSIQINHSSLDFLDVSVTDLNGKEIYKGRYAGISNTISINVSKLETGTYFLYFKDVNSSKIGSYKIIKN
jgi:hypothetical protein